VFDESMHRSDIIHCTVVRDHTETIRDQSDFSFCSVLIANTFFCKSLCAVNDRSYKQTAYSTFQQADAIQSR